MIHYIRALFQSYKKLSREDFNTLDFDSNDSLPAEAVLLLALHNKQRRADRPLKINDSLMKAAQRHAEWMATNNNLSHNEGLRGPKLVDRARNAGYNSGYVGENIAYGPTNPESVVKLWMGSWGHRANIVNYNYNDVGFGIAKSNNGRIYWCTVFGRS